MCCCFGKEIQNRFLYKLSKSYLRCFTNYVQVAEYTNPYKHKTEEYSYISANESYGSVAGGSFEVTLQNFTRQQCQGTKQIGEIQTGTEKRQTMFIGSHLRRQENPGNKGKDTFRETNA